MWTDYLPATLSASGTNPELDAALDNRRVNQV